MESFKKIINILKSNYFSISILIELDTSLTYSDKIFQKRNEYQMRYYFKFNVYSRLVCPEHFLT